MPCTPTEFEMSERDHGRLINAIWTNGPVARVWADLAARMGFDPASVAAVDGKGSQFFTARAS